MVKVCGLNIFYKGPTDAICLKSAYELRSFNYFQRSTVQEFMSFASKTIVERTQQAARQSVKEGEHICHVFCDTDGLAAVAITDHDYPGRVAHTLLEKILKDFREKVSSDAWPRGPDACSSYPQSSIQAFLTLWQNPLECDSMTRIQNDLDETKIILHNTIEAVLERGEKLDDLVQKSEGLTMQSKAFYKTARKTNSCCSYT